MKRKGNIYQYMISDENIREAILEVNKTHRWRKNHKPNKVVKWVEEDIDARIIELREIIENGFHNGKIKKKHIYDITSEKYRDIYEPQLYPDQYIHHILIQVIKDPIMRKMDKYVCGSIPKRGTHYGVKAIKKWRKDNKGTKYCAELDIRHFYQNIRPKLVVECLSKIVKDRNVIELAERIMESGILIGFYTSQWFANLVLQELDEHIRDNSTYYIRYMDNMTIFHSNKRKLHRLVKYTDKWLNAHKLKLKANWQVFNTIYRLPNALGYRYGKTYTIIRKRNLFRLKKQLKRVYRRFIKYGKATLHQSCGLISRIGQLKWCNSARLRCKYIANGLMLRLKNIVRVNQRRKMLLWT